MAEPLERLLSRPRKRNPFSDVMGPDPLDSASMMDAAQGTNVSTPASTLATSAVDPGSFAMLGGGGQGGAPVRTAEYSGGEGGEMDAPVQETGGFGIFRRGAPAQRQQGTTGNCPGGMCGKPNVFVDDGGFVVTNGAPYASSATTTIGAPAVVTSSPAVSVAAPAYPTRNKGERMDDYTTRLIEYTQQEVARADAEADSWRASGEPAEAAGAERRGERLRTDIDAAQGRLDSERQWILSQEAAKQSAMAVASESNLTNAQADAIRSGIPSNIMDDRLALLAQVIDGAANPQFYVDAVMATPDLAVVDGDKDGKKTQGAQVPSMTPEARTAKEKRARAEAYSGLAIGMMIKSPVFRQTADKGGLSATELARKEGEGDEEYYSRVGMAQGPNMDYVNRAVGSIISAYQSQDNWLTGNWADIDTQMQSDILAPLNRFVTKTYLDQQADDIKAGRVTQKDVETRAYTDAFTMYNMISRKALQAWAGSRATPQTYNPNYDFSTNMRMQQKAFTPPAEPQPEPQPEPPQQQQQGFNQSYSPTSPWPSPQPSQDNPFGLRMPTFTPRTRPAQ